MVANDILVLVIRWRYVRENPIIIPALGHVFDVGEDLATFENRIPQELEHRARHIGMPNNAVRLPYQLGVGIVGNLTKLLIHVCEAALEIGLGDDDFLFAEEDLGVGWCNDLCHSSAV